MLEAAKNTSDELVPSELYPEGLPPLKDVDDNPLGLFDKKREEELGIHIKQASKEGDEYTIEGQVVTLDSATEPQGLLHSLQEGGPSSEGIQKSLGNFIQDKRSRLTQWAQQVGIL